MINQAPTYNLMVVLMETGLKADTLRAWERRYGLPAPKRTSGGHRLYSDYDIATVKWLQARMAEGLSISRAVELWKDLIASGRAPLDELRFAASAAINLNFRPSAENLDALRHTWLEACLRFDTAGAEELLNQAFASYPIERVGSELLREGLQWIGNQWYLGEVTVYQEHFASAMAVRRIQSLITSAPQPARNQTVVIGCPPGELHTFPALYLNLLLLQKGLRVVYLGADLPLEQMGTSISDINPNLVIMVSQQLTTASSLLSVAYELFDLGVPMAYGGQVFNHYPQIRSRFPATFLGEKLEETLETAEQLILHPENGQLVNVSPNPYSMLLKQFEEARPSIEYSLEENLTTAGMSLEKIREVNTYTGDRLSSALNLGDLDLMQGEMDWISELIRNRGEPVDKLCIYLDHYSKSISNHLGEECYPIIGQLQKYVSSLAG